MIVSSERLAVSSMKTGVKLTIGWRIHCLLLAVFLLTVPMALAQQGKKLPRIGFLQPGVFPPAYREAFRQGLRKLGYVEGQNILIEYRLAQGFSLGHGVRYSKFVLSRDAIITQCHVSPRVYVHADPNLQQPAPTTASVEP